MISLRQNDVADVANVTKSFWCDNGIIIKKKDCLVVIVATCYGKLSLQEWDEDLAHGASLLAGSCVYGHGHTTWPGSPFGSVGQNLFMDTAAYSVSWPLRTWWYEKWNYDYNSGTCSFICGHYTQVSDRHWNENVVLFTFLSVTNFLWDVITHPWANFDGD